MIIIYEARTVGFVLFPPTYPEMHPTTTGVPRHCASIQIERERELTHMGVSKVQKNPLPGVIKLRVGFRRILQRFLW